jgi:hypothetical protein
MDGRAWAHRLRQRKWWCENLDCSIRRSAISSVKSELLNDQLTPGKPAAVLNPGVDAKPKHRTAETGLSGGGRPRLSASGGGAGTGRRLRPTALRIEDRDERMIERVPHVVC